MRKQSKKIININKTINKVTIHSRKMKTKVAYLGLLKVFLSEIIMM